MSYAMLPLLMPAGSFQTASVPSTVRICPSVAPAGSIFGAVTPLLAIEPRCHQSPACRIVGRYQQNFTLSGIRTPDF